jgi:sterol carrier protein 2
MMAKQAATKCFNETGLTPDNVDVVEVHDCFSCNEMLMYEALGLAKEGTGYQMIRNSQWRTNKQGFTRFYFIFIYWGVWV